MSNDSATSKEVGAPANEETEITPAMVAAGKLALCDEVLLDEEREVVVRAIYVAMEAARVGEDRAFERPLATTGRKEQR